MALTTAQRMDLAGDIGIADDESIFSDAELDRFYERGNSNYKKALVYALRQLLTDPVRFKRYASCFDAKERDGLRASLEKRLTQAEKSASMTGGTLSSNTIALGLDQPDPSTDASLSNYQREF